MHRTDEKKDIQVSFQHAIQLYYTSYGGLLKANTLHATICKDMIVIYHSSMNPRELCFTDEEDL